MGGFLRQQFDQFAPADNGAVLLLDSNGWEGVTLAPATGATNNTDQYLRGSGTDFGTTANPTHLWSTVDAWCHYVLYIKGNGNPAPATTYGFAEITNGVTRHDGTTGKVLTFQIGPDDPPNGSVPQIRWTDYQEQGDEANDGRTEPVFYSRRWLSFDSGTLDRARDVGENDYYWIIEEFKCEPDFRFRVQLQYDETLDKLIVVAHTDVLTNANPIDYGENTEVEITLGDFHKFETFIDRPNGIYKCTVNGQTIIDLDYGPGTDLYGASGNVMNFPMFVQSYHNAHEPDHPDGPSVLRCSDIQIYDRPPADAWSA